MKRPSPNYRSDIRPVWCPGCGCYGVLTSLEKALVGLEIPPENIALISGIGCSGRLSHYLNTYSLHGTHGRALPLALGVKAARTDLTVVTVGGDGDGLGIGGGHISHAARKNVDITYLMIDNLVYGLTKGQASPTTPIGHPTKTSPYGTYEDVLMPIPIFLAYDVSFVARAVGTEIKDLTEIIKEAIIHKGMSIVYILSGCRTFPVLDFKEMTSRLNPLPSDHDRADKLKATELAYSNDPPYTGIFYQVRKPTLEHRLQEDIRKAQAASGGRAAGIEELLHRFA
jgi:2-oxoglutarate ferredoxin oxidoreductase subunit beta